MLDVGDGDPPLEFSQHQYPVKVRLTIHLPLWELQGVTAI
jgi:hypothetical protein